LTIVAIIARTAFARVRAGSGWFKNVIIKFIDLLTLPLIIEGLYKESIERTIVSRVNHTIYYYVYGSIVPRGCCTENATKNYGSGVITEGTNRTLTPCGD
jgi:hypothetical protein